MSVPMTKADILLRFNTIVRDQISPSLGAAPNYFGVTASAYAAVDNHENLGLRAEPPMGPSHPQWATEHSLRLAQADQGVMVANSIFNLLHNFAMTYTRVRQAKWIYIVGTTVTEGTIALTALKPRFALYFDLPETPPLTGEVADAASIDGFLELLRDKVNTIRTHPEYMHTYGALGCHASCHTSCHGSRGRR